MFFPSLLLPAVHDIMSSFVVLYFTTVSESTAQVACVESTSIESFYGSCRGMSPLTQVIRVCPSLVGRTSVRFDVEFVFEAFYEG
jgi:hypothetical protein